MSTQSKTLRLYLNHALRHKGYVVGLLLWLPVVVVFSQIVPPIIVANILDKLSSGDFISGEVWQSFGEQLVIYALIVFVTNTIFWRIYIFMVWKLEIYTVRDIARRMFNHLSSLDMEFHNNSFGGSLVSRTNKLTGSYIRLADTFLFELYGLVVMSIATGVVLWSRVPYFVIGLYIISIIYITFAVLITKKIRVLSSVEASKQNKQTGYLADMVTNVLAVKSFARNKFESDEFNKVTTHTEKASTKLMWSQLHRENIFASFTSSISIIALVLATVSVVSFNAEIGTVFLVLSYTTNMTMRLWDFSQRTLRNVNKALGDAQEGTETLFTKPEIQDAKTTVPISKEGGVIAFKNVNFSHDHNELFKNFNLEIAQGEKIGLIGHSGSGKTTLTKLLLRFKDVESGSIEINGVDIREAKQEDVRTVVSYVPQEPLLFHRSLEENIAYGNPDASVYEIQSAAKNAHATEFIERLPEGYKTLVGERGVKLSGGQKQRIAIARAMVKDAPVLLLDEATSALDSESEQLIQDALWKLMEGKTAIVIAHRLSTIQKMDRIVVLDEGKIVEQGTHKDLLGKKNGQYARLWKHQSGGFLQD